MTNEHNHSNGKLKIIVATVTRDRFQKVLFSKTLFYWIQGIDCSFWRLYFVYNQSDRSIFSRSVNFF